MTLRNRIIAGALALLLAGMPALAQDGGGPGGPRRGGFDMAAIQQMAMNWVKGQLAASDEEWTVLQPKLQKVMETGIEARLGGVALGALLGRGPGGAGGADNRPQTATSKAMADLRSALDDKSIGSEEIASRLKALREARQKANEAYQAAQKDLRDVLTQRQEALLVMDGILE